MKTVLPPLAAGLIVAGAVLLADSRAAKRADLMIEEIHRIEMKEDARVVWRSFLEDVEEDAARRGTAAVERMKVWDRAREKATTDEDFTRIDKAEAEENAEFEKEEEEVTKNIKSTAGKITKWRGPDPDFMPSEFSGRPKPP